MTAAETGLLALCVMGQEGRLDTVDFLSIIYIASMLSACTRMRVTVAIVGTSVAVQRGRNARTPGPVVNNSTAISNVINLSTREPTSPNRSPAAEALLASTKAESAVASKSTIAEERKEQPQSISSDDKLKQSSVIRSTLLRSSVSYSLPLSLEIVGFEDYVQEDVTHVVLPIPCDTSRDT